MKSKFIAFLAFWPTIYTALLVTATFAVVSNLENHSNWLTTFYKGLGLLWLPTFWLFFGTVIYFLIKIFKAKIVPEEQRLNWGAAVFFLGLISFPIFWFKYLRREQPYHYANKSGTGPSAGIDTSI
jgi:hypothetical protein